ncbi:MAG: 4-(cytidine 5'-diphospho)-2-C-methyl-D-erythritol kinase [Phycisphaerales bacterium]|nr:4-(cytidine 5'-diphospho)-2-C-methyl-D-erythritol kinase [Phycisphaerales bacterium]
MIPRLELPAPAKINLALRVSPIRPDGFHPIESLVALIDLCDDMTFEPDPRGGIAVEIDARSPRAIADIPTDHRNLAAKAALTLREAAGLDPSRVGVRICIHKRIPAGAGLGGGSSNAAATLIALNELWELSLDAGRLAEIGAAIGSDVPLFMSTPVSVMRGRGEVVSPSTLRLNARIVLLIPPFGCATGAVYRAYDDIGVDSGADRFAALLTKGELGASIVSELFNDLELPASQVEPRLRALKSRAEHATDRPFVLTGSGAAMFTLAPDVMTAGEIAQDLRAELGGACEAVVASPCYADRS